MNPGQCLAALMMIVLSATAAWCQAPTQSDPPKKASDEEIEQLIKKLGSADFKTRDGAARLLTKMDEALPALKQAINAPDLETRRRVEVIVAAIELRLTDHFIKEAVARVNEEGLDLFVDRMVFEKGYATEIRWKAAIDVARGLAKRASQAGGPSPTGLDRELLNGPVQTSVNNGLTRGRLLLNKVDQKMLGAVHDCFLITSDSIKATNSTDRSILFVNGNIESLNSTVDSIIFCSGRIKSFNYTKNCIIYCAGDIESMNSTENNAIFVRGELRSMNFTKGNVIEAARFGNGNLSQGNTYLNGTPLPRRGMNDRQLQLDPSPLTLIQFFDPARIGLSFSMVDGDARVDNVSAGKPFAKAGLAKGDLILGVEREKFLASDDFVRLLRRRVALGQAALKVQRDDRVVNLKVEFGK